MEKPQKQMSRRDYLRSVLMSASEEVRADTLADTVARGLAVLIAEYIELVDDDVAALDIARVTLERLTDSRRYAGESVADIAKRALEDLRAVRGEE